MPSRHFPVLAAGAITTAADRQRALAGGAGGVVVGTRLYASHEALGNRRRQGQAR